MSKTLKAAMATNIMNNGITVTHNIFFTRKENLDNRVPISSIAISAITSTAIRVF
jgi:hypothetical protein